MCWKRAICLEFMEKVWTIVFRCHSNTNIWNSDFNSGWFCQSNRLMSLSTTIRPCLRLKDRSTFRQSWGYKLFLNLLNWKTFQTLSHSPSCRYHIYCRLWRGGGWSAPSVVKPYSSGITILASKSLFFYRIAKYISQIKLVRLQICHTFWVCKH